MHRIIGIFVELARPVPLVVAWVLGGGEYGYWIHIIPSRSTVMLRLLAIKAAHI